MTFTTLLKSPLGFTAAVIGFLGVIAGVVFEVETGHDPSATVAIIGTILAASGVLGSQQSKISGQTNGTLTAKEAQIAALVQTVTSLLPHVDQATAQSALAPVKANSDAAIKVEAAQAPEVAPIQMPDAK